MLSRRFFLSSGEAFAVAGTGLALAATRPLIGFDPLLDRNDTIAGALHSVPRSARTALRGSALQCAKTGVM
jgi:hypothetical protein